MMEIDEYQTRQYSFQGWKNDDEDKNNFHMTKEDVLSYLFDLSNNDGLPAGRSWEDISVWIIEFAINSNNSNEDFNKFIESHKNHENKENIFIVATDIIVSPDAKLMYGLCYYQAYDQTDEFYQKEFKNNIEHGFRILVDKQVSNAKLQALSSSFSMNMFSVFKKIVTRHASSVYQAKMEELFASFDNPPDGKITEMKDSIVYLWENNGYFVFFGNITKEELSEYSNNFEIAIEYNGYSLGRFIPNDDCAEMMVQLKYI